MTRKDVTRLCLVVKTLAAKRPELLPRFFAARRRTELIKIHKKMGCGFARNGRGRIKASLLLPTEAHAALLVRIWPRRYQEPPAPSPAVVTNNAELVELRRARAAAGLSLWLAADRLELQDQPRPAWNPFTKRDLSAKKAHRCHVAEEVAALPEN